MAPDVRVRPAEAGDVDPVVAFTRETWPDRPGGDYLPDVFPEWVGSDDENRRTLVAAVDGEAVGVVQSVLLSAHEAWVQGLRVNPEVRNAGVGTALTHVAFDWARDRGATVARSMVFSWNEMGLGVSRAAGFDPETEFRWAHPAPDPDADAAPGGVSESVNAAWAFWMRSAARDHLRGLGLAMDATWALRELTPAFLARAAEETRLLVVDDGGTRGFAYRTRTFERGDGTDAERWAEYGVGAWADAEACRSVLAAVARDAAACGAEKTRVLIPETVGAVSDAAAGRVDVSDEPDFVMAADLTARP